MNLRLQMLAHSHKGNSTSKATPVNQPPTREPLEAVHRSGKVSSLRAKFTHSGELKSPFLLFTNDCRFVYMRRGARVFDVVLLNYQAKREGKPPVSTRHQAGA
jgi:hypothetical protein